jgi:hypothetical protein
MAPQVLINLVNTPPLRDAVLVDSDHTRLASDGALSGELARVFREWWLESNDHVTPSGLLAALCRVEPRFKGFQQQDAHEAYQALLEAVRIEQTKARPNGGDRGAGGATLNGAAPGHADGAAPRGSTSWASASLVHSVFEGQTESRVACRRCVHVSRTLERFVDLSVEIPDQVRRARAPARPLAQAAQRRWRAAAPRPRVPRGLLLPRDRRLPGRRLLPCSARATRATTRQRLRRGCPRRRRAWRTASLCTAARSRSTPTAAARRGSARVSAPRLACDGGLERRVREQWAHACAADRSRPGAQSARGGATQVAGRSGARPSSCRLRRRPRCWSCI